MNPTVSRSLARFALLALALALLAPHVTAHVSPSPTESVVSAAATAGGRSVDADVDAQDVPGVAAAPDVTATPLVTEPKAALSVADGVSAPVPENVRATLIAKNPARYHDLESREAEVDVPLLPGGEVSVRVARGFGPTLADVTFGALGEDVHADAGHEKRSNASDRADLHDASAPSASARLTDAPASPALAPLAPDVVPTPTLRGAPAEGPDAEREGEGDARVHAASSRVADARATGDAVRVARAVAVAAAAVALPALAAWALYHRVTGAGVLKSPVRRAMMEHLQDAPGAGVRALAAAAGVTYTTAGYHLQRLESAGHVVSTRANGALRYYVTGTLDARARAWDELFSHPVARRVLAFIEAHPGTHRAAVARGVDLSTTGVAWYLKRLERAGLLERRPDGRRTRLFTVADAVGTARARVHALRSSAEA